MDSRLLVQSMSLNEKASLCSGKDFWTTKRISRLMLPSIFLADGPHGVRKQKGKSDNIGVNESIPATCFPTTATSACSWDRNLMFEIGQALGEECLQEGVSVLLGPGANIKRSPLCGRNFEYFSEDPYLTGELAAAFIDGVQSMGIGTSLKHFTANNQEKSRMIIDSIVDERALREIYLTGMEIAVKKSRPWTVMGAYNRINGTYCCENKKLLTDILREEWGFSGVVVTDWGACNDRVLGVDAGLDLEMPTSRGVNDKKIIKAVKKGKLSVKTVDRSAERLVDLILKSKDNRVYDYKYDADKHHQVARRVASESIVLLKNNKKILPIKEHCRIALIGEFAKSPRYQGAGSSLINPTRLESVYEELKNRKIDFIYAKGYDLSNETIDMDLIDEACDQASEADIVVVMAGLPEKFESEGFDRPHMRLPESHNYLIERISDIHQRVVVVLNGGSPMEMPWIESVQGLIHTYLGGQAGASAMLDVLFGIANPSGKLTESYPIRLEDNPSNAYFSVNDQRAEYRESIYVGYRYYITAQKDVLFPFGFGLSYTVFEYKDMKISQKRFKEDETIDVRVTIKNIGDRPGAEIVQLYVRDILSTPFRPDRELKGFRKIFLNPGEEEELIFNLDRRGFAYFNTYGNDWHVEEGEFEILIGASSADIRLKDTVYVESITENIELPDFRESTPVYYEIHRKNFQVEENEFITLYGRNLPNYPPRGTKPHTLNSSLEDIQGTMIGKLIGFMLRRGLKKHTGIKDESDPTYRMMWHFVYESPLRTIAMMGGDMVSIEMIEGVLKISNRRFFSGLFEILRSIHKNER